MERFEQFLNPAPAYRARPFWAWNGKLDEQELLRQIGVLQQMGFGGFFMHSRTGLETQYLGDEWFRLTRECTREGVARGLQPWIYDEDRWPSGPAGGLVTKQPQYRRKYLTLTLHGQKPLPEAPLALFAGQVEGLCIAPGWRQIQSGEEARPGETILAFCVHTMQPQDVYNGFTDSDRLSLAATERFLEVTHRQYAARCGAEFADIVGVFTDEPHRGMIFSDFSDPGAERNWSLPWTDDLPEAFTAAYGSDLIAQLPALYLQPGGKAIARVKWQYMELVQRLFIERFLMPIQTWAHENGKTTTGHFLHEDTLMAQAVPCGSMMRCYPWLDEPGIDNLSEYSFTPWAVKALESVARQLGKPWKLSELYGATGWQMRFEDYKYVGDWQTILGINVRCPHLSWYTMQGEAKRDYPGAFLHQATWYREHAALETYFARLATASSMGTPVCDTLVLHPVESLWCQIHPGWANGLSPTDAAIQSLERKFTRVFDWLMESQTDFDYGDEGLLSEHAATEPDGTLRVGRMRYRRVVVAGCVNLRATTLALLQAFRDAGGTLVFLGMPPQYVDCQKTESCWTLAGRSTQLPLQRAAVVDFFRAGQKSVSILDEAAAHDLYLQLRRAESAWIAILWNKSRRSAHTRVPIRIPEGLHAQLWDCLTGQRYALVVTNGCVHLDFAPGQEAVLYLTAEDTPLPPVRQASWEPPDLLSQVERYTLDEPNVFVLDGAKLWLEGDLLSQEDEILNLDRTLRKKLGLKPRGGEMVQPWAQKAAEPRRVNIELCYRIPVEKCPQTPVYLALEELPDMRLRINGQAVPLHKEDMFWVDRCFSVYRLPQEVWRVGENELSLSACYHENSGLEAMFLLGGFGVWFRDGRPTIGKLPPRLKIGDLVRQGLPFYSGKVGYTFRLPRGGGFALRLAKVGGSCASATCHGQTQLIPWPWHTPVWEQATAEEALEIVVVLNRRNTFGPLHRFPRKQPHISPDSFTCDDVSRYCLYPTGLLKRPALER